MFPKIFASNLIYCLIIVNDCIRLLGAARKPSLIANLLRSNMLTPNLPPMHPDIYQDTLLPAVSFAFIRLLTNPSLIFQFFTAIFITQTGLWNRSASSDYIRWLHTGSASCFLITPFTTTSSWQKETGHFSAARLSRFLSNVADGRARPWIWYYKFY